MLNTRHKVLSGLMALAFMAFTAVSPAIAPAVASETGSTASRIGGIDRYETAAKIVQAGWSKSDYAVLAAGTDENLVDALTAAPLAKLKNAPILLTKGSALDSYAEKELTRLEVKTVYVTSGSAVIKQPVIDKLKSMGITVTVLGGNDRFETSVNIAKQFSSVNKLIVTTAWANADALSVSPIAAANGIPILLTNVSTLPSGVKSYIDGIKSKVGKTYVIGGQTAVNDTVKNMLPNASRVGGADRYGTNLEVLKAFYGVVKPGKVFIANGQNSHLVDSLAGAPLAALTSSPVLLTDGAMPQATVEYAKKYLLMNKLVALGGETLVSDAVLNSLLVSSVYSAANSTIGSDSTSAPQAVKDIVRITGNGITVKNVVADYSIYISGNNVTLDNVTVKGSVFIDPGDNGTANLNKVTADKIVVLSGAKDSVHISQSQAGELVVTSRDDDSTPSTVRVAIENSSKIGNATVTTYAIIDAQTGIAIGTVTITSVPGETPKVELRGNFPDPVVVESNVNVTLADGTTVASMEVLSDTASLNVPPGASIGTYTGGSGVTVSGGGTVNGQTAGGTSGGGSGSYAPTITAVSGTTTINNTAKTITFAPPYTNAAVASVTVDQASTARIYSTKSGSPKKELGVWPLASGVNSDLFTVANLQRLNLINTFAEATATDVNFFAITNFTMILNAVKNSTIPAEKQKFYDDILPALANIGASNGQAVYNSIDMPALYTAADAATETAIENALSGAVTSFNTASDPDITLAAVSGQAGPGAFNTALSTINASASKNIFYQNVNFTALVTAIRSSASRTAIYNAIPFDTVFTALNSSSASLLANAPTIYTALDSLSATTKNNMKYAVNITEMLRQIAQGADGGRTITVELTANGMTTTYTVVF